MEKLSLKKIVGNDEIKVVDPNGKEVRKLEILKLLKIFKSHLFI
jgi:hypothetical protein